MNRLLVLPAIVLASLVIACSDDDDEPGSNPPQAPTDAATASETPVPTPTGGPDGLAFVLDSVGGDIDIDELRPHLAPELSAMTDEQIGDAIFCFPSDVNAEILDQQVQESGDTATLTVSWKVTEDAASAIETTVDRTWTFQAISDDAGNGANSTGAATGAEDDDDAPNYQVSGLPTQCPFESSDPGGTQEPAIETPEDDDE